MSLTVRRGRMWACLLLASLLSVVSVARAVFADTNVTVTIGVGETTVVIQGTTSPNAQVTFMDSGSVIGSTTADITGSYSQNFADQTPGIHTFQVFAQDTASRLTDTVSISVNVQEHAQTVVNIFLPPTLQLSTSQIQKGQSIAVAGMTAPSAQVVLYVDSSYSTLTADAGGNWNAIIATAGLQSGQHQAYAVAVKSGGEQSYATFPHAFTVLAPPGQTSGNPPSTSGGTPTGGNSSGGVSQGSNGKGAPTPSVPVITSPSNGAIVTDNVVQVTGAADSDVQIELWNRGQLAGSVFSDKNGRWTLRLTVTEFANELKARACRDGVCSAFSSSVIFFRQNPPQNGLILQLDNYLMHTTTRKTLTDMLRISGGTAPYQITVDWGDHQQDTQATSLQKLLLAHRYHRPGHYSGRVVGTDSQGQRAIVQFSVSVSAKYPTWWWLWLLVPLLLIALIWWWLQRRQYKNSGKK